MHQSSNSLENQYLAPEAL